METADDIIKKLNNCKTKEERIELENKLDNIRRKIEKDERDIFLKEKNLISGLDNKFNYYPDQYDPDFNQKIFNKKEFRDHSTDKRTKIAQSIIDELIFKKTYSQNFTSNYISSHTPYNGILLWHGVGIGKTCTALSIAENFHDYIVSHKKKIIILTPSDTLRETWRNEIFNIEREINKYKQNITSNVQCTGDRYTKEFHIDWKTIAKVDKSKMDETYNKIRKNVAKVINKYYEILGYQMLVNKVENEMIQKNILDEEYNVLDESKQIDYIRKRFSNTVIIMDEAHFIRDSAVNKMDVDVNQKDTKTKLATPYIEMIARYAENTKIILSTATPMYNMANEIVWLLNILLMNDKRAPLKEKEIFKETGRFVNENSKKLLLEAAQGYISYVRSENPFDFPLKLEPTGDNIYTPQPKIEWKMGKDGVRKKKEIKISSDLIKDIKFYKDPMSDYQYEEYLETVKGDKSEIKSVGFGNNSRQASNIIFPKIDRSNVIGQKGFDNCIEYDTQTKKYSYNEYFKKNKNFVEFLKDNNIGNYSSKFKNILDSIKSSVGIVFVYSQYIDSGINALSLVLEENGFKRYIESNKIEHILNTETTNKKDNDYCIIHNKKYGELTNDEKKNFKQATYIYLDATVKNLNELIRICNNEDNKYGHNIKVILGSRVTGQGLNLKNVREVHIMDPWFHFNSLEQSIGRAIRRNSHNALPEDERNATIYIHIATPPNDHEDSKEGLESADEHDYRIAYKKATYMAEVQRLLKENAIDCENNLYGNVYLKEDYSNMDRYIKDSKGQIRKISIYDKDNSLLCDLRKCNLTCKTMTKNINRNTLLDLATFTPFHQSNMKVIYKEIIKQIFINDMTYNENNIITEIMNTAQDMGYIPQSISKDDYNMNKNIIFKCLTEMINDKEYVYNYEFRPGIIQVFKGSYVFTPIELEKMDKYIPLLNRDFPNMERKPDKDKVTEIVDKLCSKEMKEKVEEVKMEDVSSKLENLLKQSKKHIENNYMDYDEHKSENIYLPTKGLMIKYKFQSLFEIEYADKINEKYELLKKIVLDKVNGIKLNEIEEYILELYDTSNKNSYIIRDNKNNIIGLRLIYINPIDNKSKVKIDSDGITQNIYIISSKKDKLIPITDKEEREEYVWRPWDNNISLYGWLDKEKDGSIRFYILRKINENKEEVLNLKYDIKGTLCTSGSIKQGTTKKSVIYHILNNLKEREIDYYNYNKYKGEETGGKDNIGREQLCDELELILRHRDSIDGSYNDRFFYRMEERSYLDNIKLYEKKKNK